MTMLAVAIGLEAAKVRTRTVLLLVCAAALALSTVSAAFFAWVVAAMVADGVAVGPEEAFAFCVSRASLAPAAAAVVGSLVGGSDLRSGTISATLVRIPRRRTVLAAKYVVAAGASVVLAIAGLAVNASTLAVVGPGVDVWSAPGAVLGSAAGHVGIAVAWGLVACAVAVLSRSPVTGLGVVLGLAYVVEPALGLALTGWGGPWGTVAAHLPFTAISSLQLRYGPDAPVLLADPSTMAAPAVAALVLVAACTALVLASRTSFSGLDVRG